MTRAFGRAAAVILAWGVGAVTAALVGVLALSLIGAALADRAMPPLTAVAAGVSPSPSGPSNAGVSAGAQPPGDTPTPEPALSPPVERVLTVEAGSVLARCTDGRIYLVSWSPAQGYRVGDVRRGPASTANVVFISSHQRYTLRVNCVAGVPHVTVLDGEDSAHHDG